MNGATEYNAKRNKSEKDKYDFTHMRNLRNKTKGKIREGERNQETDFFF